MITKKVILTGSFGVGKTSLFNQFIFSQFGDKYLSTIGVTINKKVIKIDDIELCIMLWDIAGELSQDKVPSSYFLNASGIIYVFDLNRPTTYKNMAENIEYLKNIFDGDVIKVVGNKLDLINEEKIAALKADVPVPWDFLTSAKTGQHVEELFHELGVELMKK